MSNCTENYEFTTHEEFIAMICHNVNYEYCKHLGDTSQTVWELAPQWQKDSALAGVKAILANPYSTPKQSHENWMAHKQADGWVYGEEKNVEKKTHPCMLPYDELPEQQKLKDVIFRGIVLAFPPIPA